MSNTEDKTADAKETDLVDDLESALFDELEAEPEKETKKETVAAHRPIRKRKRKGVLKNEEVKRIVEQMTELQRERFNTVKTTNYNKKQIRSLIMPIVRGNVHPSVPAVLAALAKQHVGELTEAALEIMAERNETGPIRPVHLRAAHRRLRKQEVLPLNEGNKKVKLNRGGVARPSQYPLWL